MFQSSLRTAQGASMPRPHLTEEKGGFPSPLELLGLGMGPMWGPWTSTSTSSCPRMLAQARAGQKRPGTHSWGPRRTLPKPVLCLPVLLPPSAQDPTRGLECPSPTPAVLSPNRRHRLPLPLHASCKTERESQLATVRVLSLPTAVASAQDRSWNRMRAAPRDPHAAG